MLAGDFNVVPTDRDIYTTKSYAKDALLRPESRACFARILGQGWTDAIRSLHPNDPMYTYWSYLRNRWPRDAGLRIDHLLLSKGAAKRLVAAGVDRPVRGEEGASDHAPVLIELRDVAPTRPASPALPKIAPTIVARKARATKSPRKATGRPPLLVIDGDSFVHRAYHAPDERPASGCF